MPDKDTLNYNFLGGYHNAGDSVEIPEGAMIVPSLNVIYTRKGRPISVKDGLLIGNIGGTRAFPLDSSLVGFLGADATTNAGRGNMFQGVGKNLWFVGNNISDGVRVYSNFPDSPALMPIGGVAQIESIHVITGASADGTLSLTVTGANLTGSPISVTASVLTSDTNDEVASKIAAAFRAETDISDVYYVQLLDDVIYLIDKTIRANDGTLVIALTGAGGTGVTVGASGNAATGSIDTSADLSSTPQLAKWNGSGWDTPVQVGLAVQEDAPQLILTSDTTRDDYFEGILTGSTSARIARKRGGSISIASGASNIITGDSDSFYTLIPAYPEDGSSLDDRIWILYYTYKGKGSQAAHFQFPIEIPETVLNGTADLGWSSTQGNARVKVISQHDSDIAQRKIEVEFYDNDLLLIEPFDEYFAADACKFIVPLGNVTCLVGSGTDSTGFDVSFPNFREAFNAEWRDWFSEVPVAVATASELGMFWTLTANTVYQAIWSGAEQGTAPVILRQVTSKYGAIGENASVSVNGVLYFLSKGGTPVRINSNGEIDVEFGKIVSNVFTNYDDTSVLTYDEATNSILWEYQDGFIAWQIDNQKWSSIGQQNCEGILCGFSINGHAYFCDYNGIFDTFEYNSGGDQSWLAVGAFQTGKSWLALKDIIEGQIITEGAAQPYTITVKAYKNFSTSSVETLFTHTATVTGVSISTRKLLERLDFQSISIGASGTKGSQTVHAVTAVVDVHEIERE